MVQFTIDGDGFSSVFYDAQDWGTLIEKIHPLCSAGKFFASKFTILKSKQAGDKNNSVGYIVQRKGRTRPFKIDSSGFQFGWRPILDPDIPFDEKDMPEGTIMTGGSLYVAAPGETEFRCVNRPGPTDPYTYQKGVRFYIGDTGTPEQTLKWVVAQGRLVCQSVLVSNISYSELRTIV